MTHFLNIETYEDILFSHGQGCMMKRNVATFQMRIIAFLTDCAVADRIINLLKLGFAADKPPPPLHTLNPSLTSSRS